MVSTVVGAGGRGRLISTCYAGCGNVGRLKIVDCIVEINLCRAQIHRAESLGSNTAGNGCLILLSMEVVDNDVLRNVGGIEAVVLVLVRASEDGDIAGSTLTVSYSKTVDVYVAVPA